MASMARARELNPLDSVTWALSAQVAFQGRDMGGRGDLARRAIVLDPQLWIGYIVSSVRPTRPPVSPDLALEAIADGERLAQRQQQGSTSMRGYVLARMGRTAAAREVGRRR